MVTEEKIIDFCSGLGAVFLVNIGIFIILNLKPSVINKAKKIHMELRILKYLDEFGLSWLQKDL